MYKGEQANKKAVLQTRFSHYIPSKMPLKSSRRVKHSPLETVNVKAAEAPAFPNTDSTLLGLPLELIMEILSHLDCLPIITGKVYGLFGIDPSVSRRYLERTNALRALSQTCRSWRNLFFPLLWERIEPCLTDYPSENWCEVYGDSLIRKSALVCENPEIASHVRCVQIRTL
jgi:F-box-like